jgi:hypothetical protein
MNSSDPSILFDQLFLEAEKRFGRRSRALSITVMPRDNLIPETVRNGDTCCVYYSREAENDPQRLRFQLAHEVIDVLSGALRRDARKLDEGFAVWFSLQQSDRNYRRRARRSLPHLFAEALKLFDQMKPTDIKIKELRSKCSDLDNVRTENLEEIFLVSREQAQSILLRVPMEMHARLT